MIPKINYNLKNLIFLSICWFLKYILECILVVYEKDKTIIEVAILCDDKLIESYTFINYHQSNKKE
jgi:hypothetical protein